jgi:hypothetical protein
MNKQDELVNNYQALIKKFRSEEALTLLKRLASQVKPILKNRNWTIKNLCEFFPTNPNLLGILLLRLIPKIDPQKLTSFSTKVLMSTEAGRSTYDCDLISTKLNF